MNAPIKTLIFGLFVAGFYSTATIAQTPAAAQPCSSQHHTEFDFWLGEWRVTTPDGKHAGDNTLSKIQAGCIVHENWRSATSPYTGTSVNFYNSQTQMWEQLWLDNQGGSLKLRGRREGNQMIMRSEAQTNDAGEETINQITWTKNDNGSVRQEWVVLTTDSDGDSKDNKVVFDGLYQRPE